LSHFKQSQNSFDEGSVHRKAWAYTGQYRYAMFHAMVHLVKAQMFYSRNMTS